MHRQEGFKQSTGSMQALCSQKDGIFKTEYKQKKTTKSQETV